MLKHIFSFLLPARASKPEPLRVQVRQAAYRYLDSRHYTLYADWDISKPNSKARAAEWLTTQVINVLEEMAK